MNVETQTAPSVGISFADLLRYNESEAETRGGPRAAVKRDRAGGHARTQIDFLKS